jgi:hypothetical protein
MKKISRIFKSGLFIAPLFMGLLSVNAQSVVVDQAEKSFSSITSLEVEGSFCTVVVTPQEGHNIHFKGEIKASKQRDDLKIKYSVANNTLKVWIERPNSLMGSFGGVLEFKVPSTTNIRVDNSSGSVKVSGIGNAIVNLKASSGSISAATIGSDLSCQTSSGSLSVTDVKGNLKSSSSSGSQQIKNVGGNVETLASSGSIRIEGVGGTTKAESSSGSISVSNTKASAKVAATSGSLKISGVTGDVKANTSSGSISLNQVKGALSLQTTSGSQGGSGITLTGNSGFSSSSGSISMELLNDAASLSFNLEASSGGLYAKGVKGSRNLVVEKGAIRVTGQSSSGSQSYK